MNPVLQISGQVEKPLQLTFADLQAIAAEHQLPDVSTVAPKRQGSAVKLAGLLSLAGARPEASFLGLHSSTDDFHASIPLGPVLDRGLLIYELNGQPLPVAQGGPLRFFIPDHAACRVDEIDECANLKFVDHLELTVEKGYDNRPEDEDEHEQLHAKE
ncbi:molybdopterin-dependent oxidoreductase [Lignipirellula cremea]|uniref:Oxidoreductase molybdopterin binding domain protein n=1 Tax=Lignipirellula cremea TaxID=2528010 RepID=A0A518DN56_9BACT|nr:molybdopterin-dependent oxidoreductase [Lignipirellula cremea]QDU93277.1 Oxidoreductase molybdopterin binding domain protein [Lignipirellula cremea]